MWNDEASEIVEYGPGGAQLAHEPQVSVGLARTPEDGSTLGLLVKASQVIQRDSTKMIARAKQIGGLLGGDGFYRFPMGGENIEGPSIAMAQALAQEWGGVIYQVRIVHTEQLASGGQRVHLRASVADMRSLVCAEVDQVISTAPPPGKFANKADQRERWHSMQLQSASSKIVRNAILRVLPDWYVQPAFDAAKDVDGKKALNGKSLPEARKVAAEALRSEFGCSQEELEAYLGQPIDMWAVPQVSALRDLYKSLKSDAQSVEAWRAGLSAKTENASAPRRGALGLPAESSSKPVDLAENKKSEPASNGRRRGHATVPGQRIDQETGEVTDEMDPEPPAEDAAR